MKTKDDVKYELFQESQVCGLCKKPLTIKEVYTRKVNIDHKKPRYYGGKNNRNNLQLAHTICNKRKGHDYTPKDKKGERE